MLFKNNFASFEVQEVATLHKRALAMKNIFFANLVQ